MELRFYQLIVSTTETAENVRVQFDWETGDIKVLSRRLVVDESYRPA